VADDNPYYDLALKFGQAMAAKKYMTITGAADGIMRAGIEGARPENSFGLIFSSIGTSTGESNSR